MKLAVDALAAVPGHKGLGRFQVRLLRELASASPSGVEGTVLAQPAFGQLDAPVPVGWHVAHVRGGRALARDLVGVPSTLRRAGADVFLTTTDRLRAPRGVPVVLYVFEDPQRRVSLQAADPATSTRQKIADRLSTRWFDRTVRLAAHVVAASTSTAEELVARRGVPPGKVTVAMPGPFLDPEPWRGPSDAEPRVLAFIDRDVRDNGRVALLAFSRTPSPWRLDVIGDADPRLVALARDLGLTNRITFHGRVSDERVREAFAASQIYLDCTLFEGFGAQAAEAARAGIPSIVSGTTSLPEVTQHRARYVDPLDEDEIAAALSELMASPCARERAGAAFSPDEIDARWPRLVDHLLTQCRRVAGHP